MNLFWVLLFDRSSVVEPFIIIGGNVSVLDLSVAERGGGFNAPYGKHTDFTAYVHYLHSRFEPLHPISLKFRNGA